MNLEMNTLRHYCLLLLILQVFVIQTNCDSKPLNEIYECFHIFPRSDIAVSLSNKIIIYNITNNKVIKELPIQIKSNAYDTLFPIFFKDDYIYYIYDDSIFSYNFQKAEYPKRVIKLKIDQLGNIIDIIYHNDNIYYTYNLYDKTKHINRYFISLNNHIIAESTNFISIKFIDNNVYYHYINSNGKSDVYILNDSGSHKIYSDFNIWCLNSFGKDKLLIRICENNCAGGCGYLDFVIFDREKRGVISKIRIDNICVGGDCPFIPLPEKESILILANPIENINGPESLYCYNITENKLEKINIGYFINQPTSYKSPSIIYDYEIDRLFARVIDNNKNKIILINNFTKYLP